MAKDPIHKTNKALQVLLERELFLTFLGPYTKEKYDEIIKTMMTWDYLDVWFYFWFDAPTIFTKEESNEN